MATLTVTKFETVDGADRALEVLTSLQKEELVHIQDAAVVSWDAGKKKPKTRQANNMTAAGALGGTFWGLLFGLIFFMPFLGAVIGAAAGALGGAMTDVGIDDDFIKSVRDKVTPGTSALFLMSSDAVLDRVRAAFEAAGLQGELIQTNLSAEDETKLRAAFSEE